MQRAAGPGHVEGVEGRCQLPGWQRKCKCERVGLKPLSDRFAVVWFHVFNHTLGYSCPPLASQPGCSELAVHSSESRLPARSLARVPVRLLPAQVNKQTSELVFDHLHATAFQHSPLGRTILGPVDNIETINREQLVQYMKTHYRGPRMVSGCAHVPGKGHLAALSEKLLVQGGRSESVV